MELSLVVGIARTARWTRCRWTLARIDTIDEVAYLPARRPFLHYCCLRGMAKAA